MQILDISKVRSFLKYKILVKTTIRDSCFYSVDIDQILFKYIFSNFFYLNCFYLYFLDHEGGPLGSAGPWAAAHKAHA